jgi:glycosyltransferase involved in cell wall biosynthesis
VSIAAVDVERLTSVTPRPAMSDVVFVMGFTAWDAALRRGLSFSEDRLADALARYEGIRRLIVADPYRSRPLKLARDFITGDPQPLPGGEGRWRHQPLRLRRLDPTRRSTMLRSVKRYERALQSAAERHGLVSPALISCNPMLAGFGELSWCSSVTYYGWDDFAKVPIKQPWWPLYLEAYERLRVTGRRVVTISAAALERIAPTGPAAVVPNAVDPKEWREPGPPPSWFAALPHPRLLYVGSLDRRIDVAQVKATARAFPEGSVTLVGPMLDRPHFRSLRDEPNILIKPYAARPDVAAIMRTADACLIPHVRSPLTEAMSPLKLYEYAAAGRPIATVDLGPILSAGIPVCVAAAGGDLVPAVREALARGPLAEPERQDVINRHGWAVRFEHLLDIALSPDDQFKP